jgi:hypothetical protein
MDDEIEQHFEETKLQLASQAQQHVEALKESFDQSLCTIIDRHRLEIEHRDRLHAMQLTMCRRQLKRTIQRCEEHVRDIRRKHVKQLATLAHRRIS